MTQQLFRLATPADFPHDLIAGARQKWEEDEKPGLRPWHEFSEQCCAASWLVKQHRWLSRRRWWHTPNEEADEQVSKDNIRAGVLPGVSDIIITLPRIRAGVCWPGSLIEIKRVDAPRTTRSALRKTQVAFLREHYEAGWIVTWARGAIEFRMIVEAIYSEEIAQDGG